MGGLGLALGAGALLLFALPSRLRLPLPQEPWLKALGALLGLAGLGLWWSGAAWLVFVGRGTPNPWHHPPPVLVQSGPYRRLRHPIYLGILLLIASKALLDANALLLCLLPPLLVLALRAIGREEATLAARHGQAWALYRRRTGRLLPRMSFRSQEPPCTWP